MGQLGAGIQIVLFKILIITVMKRLSLTHEPFLFILGDVGGQGQANS